MSEPASDLQAALLSMTHGRSILTTPPDILRLAEGLSKIHGDIHIASETGGIHLYMASPFLLATEGDRELGKRHLAVNASKYFGHAGWPDGFEKMKPWKREKCALCMKSKNTYKVENLLRMKPLDERGSLAGPGKVIDNAKERHQIDDGHGNKIPDHPGEVQSVLDLPADHPAIVYLTIRKYDNLPLLVKQFNLQWCWREAPVDKSIGRYYRKLHAGWRDTPQGRLIFHGFINGVRRIWQGRYLDLVQGNDRFVWHPYREEWTPEAYRLGPDQPWILRHPFCEPFTNGAGEAVRWAPHKYMNGLGCQRAEWGLFGFDAAVAFQPDRSKRYGILCEGPLDAGRFGPPAFAGAGAYLSSEQAKIIASAFPVIILAQDADKAGDTGRRGARQALAAQGVRVFDIAPDPGVDFGLMTRGACWSKVFPILPQIHS